jgi:hypothetical protein
MLLNGFHHLTATLMIASSLMANSTSSLLSPKLGFVKLLSRKMRRSVRSVLLKHAPHEVK